MHKSHHTTYMKKCEKPDFAAVVGKLFSRKFVQLGINRYSTKLDMDELILKKVD